MSVGTHGARQALPAPSFAHLDRLTDAGGLHEHARGTVPRPEHAYCTDDVARGLLVTAREPGADARVARLRSQYLAFVVTAVAEDGQVHNRRGKDQRWHDRPSLDDCWGRALHGLGTLVGVGTGTGAGTGTGTGTGTGPCAVAPAELDVALTAFERAATRRSPHLRATALAVLAASEVLRTHPHHRAATDLLDDACADLWRRTGPPAPSGQAWPWPEPRLAYANAAVAEALVAAGDVLDRPELLERGLHLLGWLLDVQTLAGHLSVVPSGGRGPGETGPGFDQQPIEVGVLADACARAHQVTGEARWADGVRAAAGWFLGDNDRGVAMVDIVTGGGYDGLMVHGRNENQGAESTLAALSTLQHASRLRSAAAAA